MYSQRQSYRGEEKVERGGWRKRERQRWHSGWKATVYFGRGKRFQSGGFGRLCGRPDMKNEKVRFLAQGKRFAGTEPEEAFCASRLPQVTDRRGCETLSWGRKQIPQTATGGEEIESEIKPRLKRSEIHPMSKSSPGES